MASLPPQTGKGQKTMKAAVELLGNAVCPPVAAGIVKQISEVA